MTGSFTRRLQPCRFKTDADLVFVVQKGRLGAMQGGGTIGLGSPLPRGPIGGGPTGKGSGAVTSPDVLRVYIPSASGRRGNLIWTGSAMGGLDGPDVPLLLQLRKAVEEAYPDIAPDPKQKKP